MANDITLGAMQSALDVAPIGIVLLDSNSQVKWHNDTVKSLLGVTDQQLNPTGEETLSQELRSVLIEPPKTLLLQKGDQQRWLQCHSQSMDDGSSVRFYVDSSSEQLLRHERDQLEEDLQQLTTRDPITGLPNRRALLQSLEPLISRSRRYDNPISLIKLHVETNLQDAPDQEAAWVKVGLLLKEQMRWADIIGRYDGADFLLILPETPLEASETLASKLCEQVSQLEQDGSIKAYCGVTCWQKGDDATLMLQRINDNGLAAINSSKSVNSGS